MDTLTDEDIDVLRAVFNKYDKDRNNNLSLQQFVLLLSRLGRHVKELRGVEFQEARAAFALMDRDSDGLLSFDEFCNWWVSKNKYNYFTGETSNLLRKAYRLYTSYTKDQNRKMTYNQFENMMDELGISHTEFDFDVLDNNNDGLLSFEEFCKWLNWF